MKTKEEYEKIVGKNTYQIVNTGGCMNSIVTE